ncbi:MAG TPA: hypothetical protein VFT82_04485 [Candidatus Paceibacterota bacterium]|nr:hypothetical protein [Candidatus Paceibacterota bacterium]
MRSNNNPMTEPSLFMISFVILFAILFLLSFLSLFQSVSVPTTDHHVRVMSR